jgi:hypothetical protein
MLMTPNEWASAVSWRSSWLGAYGDRSPKHTAHVADLSGVAFGFDADPIVNAAFAMADRGAPLFDLPIAVVSDDASIDMHRRYCWLMAQRGVIRAAFCALQEAEDWARQQGRVWRLLRSAQSSLGE